VSAKKLLFINKTVLSGFIENIHSPGIFQEIQTYAKEKLDIHESILYYWETKKQVRIRILVPTFLEVTRTWLVT